MAKATPEDKLRETLLSDLQHGAFISQAARLGLEQSAFQPSRFIGLSQNIGVESPDRLTPLPFGNVPAVMPSENALRVLMGKSASDQAYDWRAMLASGFGGAPDPTDIDPQTGMARMHQPSLFKTMAAPTRFLPPELVLPQMAIPFNPQGQTFDTKTAMFKKNAVRPSSEMVDIYHRYF